QLLADRNRRDARDAPGVRFVGVVLQPLLDLGPARGLLPLRRVETRLGGRVAQRGVVGEGAALDEGLAERSSRELRPTAALSRDDSRAQRCQRRALDRAAPG